MSILVVCHACGAQHHVSDRHAGRRFACRQCGLKIRAAGDAAAAECEPDQASPTLESGRPFADEFDALTALAVPELNFAPVDEPPRIPATCGNCGHTAQARAELAGRRVRCKYCGGEFRVPGGSRHKSQPREETTWANDSPAAQPAPTSGQSRSGRPHAGGYAWPDLGDPAAGESVPLAPANPSTDAPARTYAKSVEKRARRELSLAGRGAQCTAGGGILLVLAMCAKVALRTPAIRDWLSGADRPTVSSRAESAASSSSGATGPGWSVPSWGASSSDASRPSAGSALAGALGGGSQDARPSARPPTGLLGMNPHSTPEPVEPFVTMTSATVAPYDGPARIVGEAAFSVEYTLPLSHRHHGREFAWVVQCGNGKTLRYRINPAFDNPIDALVPTDPAQDGPYQTWIELAPSRFGESAESTVVSNVIDCQILPAPEPRSDPFEHQRRTLEEHQERMRQFQEWSESQRPF